MKTFNLYLVLAIGLVFTSSCGEDFFSTTLDIDSPEVEDILVTHAFLNVDSSQLSVWVSRTEDILSNSFDREHLEGAQVTLDDDLNNSFLLDLSDTSIREYEINSISSDANEVILTTQSPQFTEEAIASQTVPSKTNVVSTKFIEDAGLDIGGDERSAVEVIFNDPLGEENFYEVFVSIRTTNDVTNDNIRSTFTDSNDPIVSKGHDFYSVIFDDTTFDGQEKRIDFSLYPISEANAENRVFITWRNITKDYFRFSKTLKSFQEQEDNPFSTPVQIFSNFENGHGIFSVYREQRLSVF